AGRLESSAEGVLAAVHARESVVRRQDGLSVAAGEVNRAGVARRQIAVGILGGEGEVASYPRRRRRREPGNDQAASGRGVDGGTSLRAGDGICDRVSGGQGLAAGGLERGAEGVLASVRNHEHIVGRQKGLRVGAGEMDCAPITVGSITEGV